MLIACCRNPWFDWLVHTRPGRKFLNSTTSVVSSAESGGRGDAGASTSKEPHG